MKDSYGTYDGRKPEPPYDHPLEAELTALRAENERLHREIADLWARIAVIDIQTMTIASTKTKLSKYASLIERARMIILQNGHLPGPATENCKCHVCQWLRDYKEGSQYHRLRDAEALRGQGK